MFSASIIFLIIILSCICKSFGYSEYEHETESQFEGVMLNKKTLARGYDCDAAVGQCHGSWRDLRDRSWSGSGGHGRKPHFEF